MCLFVDVYPVEDRRIGLYRRDITLVAFVGIWQEVARDGMVFTYFLNSPTIVREGVRVDVQLRYVLAS